MRNLVITLVLAGAAVPAGATATISGHIQVLKQDESDFEYVNLNTTGTIASSAAVAPSTATLTASIANGGTLSASYTGKSFGYVSGFFNYTITAAGPAGTPVPVQVFTNGSTSASGDMAAFIRLRIGTLYFTPGGPFGGMDVPDFPLDLQANTCSGTEAPCSPDAGQAGWSLPGSTIYLVPNRVYPVELSLTIEQTGYRDTGMFGDGTGSAMVDPVFQIAPGVTGYTLQSSLAVPEPATWALMLAGFGAIGGALRRRTAASA